MTTLPNREEVLAWMAVNRAGPDKAAAHFGMSRETIKSWVRRTRENPGPDRTRRGQPAPLTVIQTPVKPKMSKPMQALARKVLKAALERMEEVVPKADARECATIVSTLADRFDLFADLKGKKVVPTADPSTPEGEEALVSEVAALPAHILEQARQRQTG